MAIAVGKDEEWQGLWLCQAMDNHPCAQDPRVSTFLGRKEHEGELDRLLGELA